MSFLRRIVHLFSATATPTPARRTRRITGIEALESRIAPANLTASFANGTLKIVGDTDANEIIISNVTGSKTRFEITAGADTINGEAGLFTSGGGVKNLVFKLDAGNDKVTFSNSILKGNFKSLGGDGANFILFDGSTIQGNVTVKNGDAGAGLNGVYFQASVANGNLTVVNEAGNSGTGTYLSSGERAGVLGDVNITNGAGRDDIFFADPLLGGDVTIKNGAPEAGTNNAGFVQIYNEQNTSTINTIKGNLKVSYDGGVATADGLWDVDVRGNVSWNFGNATGVLQIDGSAVAAQTVVRGDFSVNSIGQCEVYIADASSATQGTGLKVLGDIEISTGASADTFRAYRLEVGGITRVSLGDGPDEIAINDSIFEGKTTFSLGNDNQGEQGGYFSLETRGGTVAGTTFNKAVVVKFADSIGAGSQLFERTGPAADQFYTAFSTFKVFEGSGLLDKPAPTGQENFPNGGSIQFI